MIQQALWSGRVIAWFSCGAASAVAAKYALEENPETLVVYNDLSASEHPDNQRFFSDVEQWLGCAIQRTVHPAYRTIDDVFEAVHFLRGQHGAPCTRKLKRDMRDLLCDFNDTNVFGFTVEEERRIKDFEKRNPDVKAWWILRDRQITKADCFQILQNAGIKLPEMYLLGFNNANCLGCVKATSPKYWNLTRKHFPEVFDRRAKQERSFGYSLCRQGFLDELAPEDDMGGMESMECGPFCQQSEEEIPKEIP
jgi:hypothetical protein